MCVFVEKQRTSHSYEHVMLYSNKERMPRAFAMQYTATLMGRSIDLLEVGILLNIFLKNTERHELNRVFDQYAVLCG